MNITPSVFYHNGSFGDMIYALPTISAMGGGTLISGLPLFHTRAIAPLLEHQDCIITVKHLSESGLPANFVDLTKFRNHPLFTRIHIADAHLYMQGLSTRQWRNGWLNIAGYKPQTPDMNVWPTPTHTPLTREIPGKIPYAVIARTHRYQDRFFDWRYELKFLDKHVRTIYFMGLEAEYTDFRTKYVDGWPSRFAFEYLPTRDFLEAAYYISRANLFSSNQTSLLAIRQGLGLPYRMEQSPNHLDTEQGSEHESIINRRTRRLHLASVCMMKALFDRRDKRY